jgi:hypothetical protein
MTLWYILEPFGIFFIAIWYVLEPFGIFFPFWYVLPEKSGSPAWLHA